MKGLLKRVLLILFPLVVIAAGSGAWWVHRQLRPVDVTAARVRWPVAMTDEAADRAAADLVSKMTLEEKVDQMTGSGLAPMVLDMLVRDEVGLVYSGANDRLGIPPIAFTDGPRGVGVGRSTSFPVAIARAASWDLDLQRRVGDAIGQEARAQGANYWGGLCLNLVRHPSMGRAQETYGEDPWLTGEMGAAILEAVQRHNVMACAKHFALNSMETARYKNDVEIDERTLQEVYFPHFRKAVEHGVASFMSAYNKVRGEWCGENRYLLTTVLREQWGFAGFVTSDWIDGLHDGVRGVHAGLDIEMPAGQFYGRNLKSLVGRGEVPRADIDASVRRIVRTKLVYLTRPDPQTYARDLVASAEHVALAREAAEKSMVLLKNDGAVLPFDRTRIKRLAVVGHLADADNTGDRGSSHVKAPHYTSALDGLRAYLGAGATVWHADGSDLDEVRRVARDADAVVVVAGTRWDEVGEYVTDDAGKTPRGPAEKRPMREKLPFRDKPLVEISGGDLVPLSLKSRDVRVIDAAARANPRTVVALVGGTVYTMEEWKNEVPSIVMAWYFGMEGGHALARLLFGDVNPERQDAADDAEGRVATALLRRVRRPDRVRAVPRLHAVRQERRGGGVPVRVRPQLHLVFVRELAGTHADGRRRGHGPRDRGRHEHGTPRGGGGRGAVRRLRGGDGRPTGQAAARFQEGPARSGPDEDRAPQRPRERPGLVRRHPALMDHRSDDVRHLRRTLLAHLRPVDGARHRERRPNTGPTRVTET